MKPISTSLRALFAFEVILVSSLHLVDQAYGATGDLVASAPASAPVVLETWIIAGQSNAEGYAITENPVAGLAPADTLATIGRTDLNISHSNITIYQGSTDFPTVTHSAGMLMAPRDSWHDMTSYEGMAYDWGSGRGNESGRRFGPELSFGFDVQQDVGAKIALIKYARGSIPISSVGSAEQNGVWKDFDPSDSRLNHYDKIVSTIQTAVDNLPADTVLNIRGVVWMQGESDANANRAADYEENLTELVGALRTDIGAIADASDGKVTKSAASWNELEFLVGTILNRNDFCHAVINAQHAVAAADNHVFAVDGTSGLSSLTLDDWGDSGIHYDTQGQVSLGERFAATAIARMNGVYAVTYDGNGNDGGAVPVDASSYSGNDSVTVLTPGTLSRTGYTFSHWSTHADGTGEEYEAGDSFTINSPITLHAQWTLSATMDYFEDFNAPGQPTGPAGSYWTLQNAVNPAQSGWNDFVPGDGKAYITVTSASHSDDRQYQTLNTGLVGPGQRLEIRAKNMAVPGYTAFLFTYADESWDEVDFDEIDIEIVASDDQGTDPGHPIGVDGGWTDARFNCWSNADAPSYTPWIGVAQPVEDNSGQPVSHMDDEWHTYTIEWINDDGLENGPNGRCLFYIDGVLQYTIHDMSPDSMSEVLIGYRDLAWAGPDNPIGWTGEHTMELDWYRVTPIDYESPNANFDSYALGGGLNAVADSVLDNDKGYRLSAEILNQPEHGVLVLNADGTFTYTPDAEFSGRDQFVYYATDGTQKGTSNACVVELIVNNSPVVDAGVDQTIVLSGSAPWNPTSVSPVVWFDASDDSSITSSGNNVTQWADKSGNANHATASVANKYPQSGLSTIDGKNVIQGVDRDEYMDISPATSPVKACFAVVSVNSGSANELMALGGQGTNPSLFVRSSGDQVSFDGSGSSQGSYSVNAAGYSSYAENHASIGISPSQTFLFSGVWQNSSPLNRIIGYDGGSNGPTSDERIAEVIWLAAEPPDGEREKIEGYLAHKWGLAGSLPSGHPYATQSPGGSGVVANLDGDVSDPDMDPLTTTWSHVGGNGAGNVVFGDASAIDTTATFSQLGTYVLRLTADDGYAQTQDEVTITVVESQTFSDWISAYSLGGLSGPGDDPDGDRLTNSIENYFGTDPGVSSQGIEMVAYSSGANASFTFTHPLNDNPASDLTASYLWSKDLTNFHADGTSDGSTTVAFEQGDPSGDMVTVTATITGPSSRVFVAVEVIQE